jgi:enterochelin esterase-like enzyme
MKLPLPALALASLLGLGTPPDAAAQPLPQVATGRIERLPSFASKHVDARHVDVWLPADYNPARRYQVLYLHDGQMLFDAATTWNRQAWDVHLAVDRLMRAGRIADTLVVGVWNVPTLRYAEFYPQKMLALAPEALRREYIERGMAGQARADAYLRFLVEELKPEIDRRYATKPGPESTAVMGSSMGGLISLYALCEYPQVFGAAGGVSTHWVGLPTAWGTERMRDSALPGAALGYLRQALPPPGRHRIYLDRGTTDLEALYAPHLPAAEALLRERGYGAGDALTRVFDGTGHNERDWAARVEIPLAFLLGPR